MLLSPQQHKLDEYFDTGNTTIAMRQKKTEFKHMLNSLKMPIVGSANPISYSTSAWL